MPYSSFSIRRIQLDIRRLGFLQTALQRGCGAILWESSYFGRRNLAKHILNHHGFAVVQVHAYDHLGGFGPAGSPESWMTEHIIRPFFDRCERSFLGDIIYLTDTDSLAALRIMLERLKHNAILCLSADGTRGYKFVSVSLFGRKCFFPTGAVSLAKISGAPMLPIFCYAESDGTIRLEILPSLRVRFDGERERELETTILEYTNLLRSYAKSYPEQYRNGTSCEDSRQPVNASSHNQLILKLEHSKIGTTDEFCRLPNITSRLRLCSPPEQGPYVPIAA